MGYDPVTCTFSAGTSKSNPSVTFSFSFLKEPIQEHIRTQILSELKDLRDVSDVLSMLDMALGFLSTAGGNPQTKITDYLQTVLLLSEGKSSLKSRKVGNEWVTQGLYNYTLPH